MTPAVSFRFFSRSPEASQHPSQLLKCSPVAMTKYFQQRQLLNSLFGSRASDAKISHFQGEVAGTWEKFSVWNMKLCLHLSFPIDDVSKAKPVVRAGFLISLQLKQEPVGEWETRLISVSLGLFYFPWVFLKAQVHVPVLVLLYASHLTLCFKTSAGGHPLNTG